MVPASMFKTLFFIASLFVSLPGWTNTISVMVEKSIYDSYQTFLGERDPLSIFDFTGPGSNRGVAELILLQQALHLGGIETPVEFVFAPTYARILKQVRLGKAAIAANSVWHYDVAPFAAQLHISEAVVKNGEFEAGIYTRADNYAILAMRTLSEIRSLTAVSSKHWTPDWKTLDSLNLKKLYNTSKWRSMVSLVIVGRADFLLAPFQQSDDMSFVSQGIRFSPIPEVKLGLSGSRHFIISRQHPAAEQLHSALTKGLAILLNNGQFTLAYQQSGFFNDKVKSWRMLNSHNINAQED